LPSSEKLKEILDELARKLNLDVSTSRSNCTSNTTSIWLKTMSFSDNDGDDSNENEVDLIA